MPESKHIPRSPKSGKCLTLESIRGYIEGRLSTDGKARVEQHIKGCPLCADAVEGYRSFNFNRSAANVAELNQRITGKQPQRLRQGIDWAPILRIAAVVAGLLVLVGGSWLVWHFTDGFQSADQSTVQTAGEETQQDAKRSAPEPRMAAIPDTAGPDTSELDETGNELASALNEQDRVVRREIKPEAPREEPEDKEEISKKSIEPLAEESPLVVQESDDNADGYFDTALRNNAAPQSKNESDKDASSGQMMEVEREAEAKDFYSTNEVDAPPAYPGGNQAMQQYISNNIQHPSGDENAALAGTVTVRFSVNEKGKVKDEEVVSGINADFNKEALRIIKRMPKWTPGKLNGHDVTVKMTVPVRFPPSQK
ncbi:MAG: TonB family protein [Bacteroidia bacterium]